MMPKGTTAPGYKNKNGQVVVKPTGLPGTDHNQKIYVLRCDNCNASYGANGSDIHIRRCPNCDGGQPGLPIEQRQRRPSGLSPTQRRAFRKSWRRRPFRRRP